MFGGLSSSSLRLNNRKVLGLVFSLSHVIASRFSIPSRLQYLAVTMMSQAPPPYYEYATGESDVYYAQQHEHWTPKIVYGETTEQYFLGEPQTSPSPQLDQQDAAILDRTLNWIPAPPSTPPLSHRLERPVAIPRMDITSILSTPFPFLRAYAPVLGSHQIDQTAFMSFIDNLCVAQAPNPSLQVLNIVGNGVGQVPHHWAQAASAGMQLVANVGTAAVSAVRTKAFLENVNKQFFNPRGLKVRLCKDEEVAKVVEFPLGRSAVA